VRDKLRFAFRLHDLDGDGGIERAEISRMIELGLSEDGAPARAVVIERFTLLVLNAADKNYDGCLSFAEFEAIAENHPDVTELVARAERSWVTTGRDLTPATDAPSPLLRLKRFLDNNAATAGIVTLWACANVALRRGAPDSWCSACCSLSRAERCALPAASSLPDASALPRVVGVGAPGLARHVARACAELDLRFHAEQF
jgi:hypothetical protein